MSNAATGSSYTLGGVLNEIVDLNLRLQPIMFKQFAHIPYAFFDVKQLAGEGGYSIKPKEIPGIESTLTVDGTRVKWLDYALFDFNSTITSTATITLSGSDATIVVGDTSGFAVNDKISLVSPAGSAGDTVDAIVKTISNTTTLVVTPTAKNGSTTIGATFEVIAGQRVERLYWRRNDNDEITRPSALYNYKEYGSNIQHFSRRIGFTKAELNKVYKYEKDAKSEAAKRLSYNISILIQELNKAIYKGSNETAGAGANQKMEMLGLEAVCVQTNSVTDLSTSTTPVKDLFRVFEKAQRNGAVVGNEPLMFLVNDRMLSELAQMNADKIRYDKRVEELKLSIPTLSTIYGEVDIIRDPMLNKLYENSVGFIVNRSLLKLWVRENQDFNPKGGVTRADQSIQFAEVIHNLREQKFYDMYFEMGLVAAGMSSDPSPFQMVKNFGL